MKGRHLVFLESGPNGARKEQEETKEPPLSVQVLGRKEEPFYTDQQDGGASGPPRNKGELRHLSLGSFPTCTARPHEALPTVLRAQQA